MKIKIFNIVLFIFIGFKHSICSPLSWLDQDSCSPFGSACTNNGLAHFYSMFHFNGRYYGDERMRIPFSIALNAAIPGGI